MPPGKTEPDRGAEAEAERRAAARAREAARRARARAQGHAGSGSGASGDQFLTASGDRRDPQAQSDRWSATDDRSHEPDSAARFRSLAEAYAVLNDPNRRALYDQRTRPAVQPLARRSRSPALHRGVLELSAREAQLAATTQLTLTTDDGTMIVLPAGLRDGDQIIVAHRGVTAVLTVRVNFARKT
jgi:hypothetical protein